MLIFGRVKYGPDHLTLGLLDYFLDLSIDYQWGREGEVGNGFSTTD